MLLGMKRATLALTIATLAAGLGLVAPAAAQTSPSPLPKGYYLTSDNYCIQGGVKIGDHALSDLHGGYAGRQYVYRHSNGYRCAFVSDQLAGTHYMDVTINRPEWVTQVTDYGYFEEYAGALGSYGCIQVESYLEADGTEYYSIDPGTPSVPTYC